VGRQVEARLPFFYGWVIVAVAFITMGVGVNARTAFSLLFPPIVDEFGWGAWHHGGGILVRLPHHRRSQPLPRPTDGSPRAAGS
jgi:hypothetical protein